MRPKTDSSVSRTKKEEDAEPVVAQCRFRAVVDLAHDHALRRPDHLPRAAADGGAARRADLRVVRRAVDGRALRSRLPHGNRGGDGTAGLPGVHDRAGGRERLAEANARIGISDSTAQLAVAGASPLLRLRSLEEAELRRVESVAEEMAG
ncbi:MAG TPA: hypothetical protein VE085_03855 [Burkholderiales bacterium]|nr:hypothetical protein [Burkholderiales bacterium]